MSLFVNILQLFGRFRFTRIPVSNYKFAARAIGICRMLIGGVYSYIHVLLDKFLFKSNSNWSIWIWFKEKLVGQNMNIRIYTPQLTFQLMSNHRRVLHLQMLQTFISDYSCLVSLFLHWPTLLGVLTITRIPISNHKFATLLDYGGVLHLQMLQTFSLIQH